MRRMFRGAVVAVVVWGTSAPLPYRAGRGPGDEGHGVELRVNPTAYEGGLGVQVQGTF